MCQESIMPSKENPLRFVQISDTHINPDTSYTSDIARFTPLVGATALIKAVNELPFVPDFILHTGDVAFDPVPEAYPFIADLLAKLKAPVYYLPGNHDDAAALQTVLMKRETVQPYIYYEFEMKGVQIICLDSNGPHNPKNPSGFVTEEQLDWLDAICTADDERPLVVAVHHNVIPVSVPWLDEWMRIENGEALHAILRQARDRLCGVFTGHIHHNYQILRDGVNYISGASSWGQLISYPTAENTMFVRDLEAEPSFNIVTITDTTSSVRRHGFRLNES
jgi:3',5'-cyclic-AMP phosphodiesterase